MLIYGPVVAATLEAVKKGFCAADEHLRVFDLARAETAFQEAGGGGDEPYALLDGVN